MTASPSGLDYFCGAWPRDSSIDVLEWLFT